MWGSPLNNKIINILDADAAADPCDAFDRELEAALLEGADAVAVCLRKEMGACVELLEWLANWQKRFAAGGKQVVVVAADARQLQYLEFSHPDANLSYVSSLEELWKKIPAFRSAETANAKKEEFARAQQPQAAPAEPVGEPAPLSAPQPLVPAPVLKSSEQKAGPQPRVSPGTATAQPRLENGERVKLSGEYACAGCGTTRMYAKGDETSACTNPECMSQSAGWKLVFELF